MVEAVLRLHVLVAPRHHPPQHAWVRRMRKLDLIFDDPGREGLRALGDDTRLRVVA